MLIYKTSENLDTFFGIHVDNLNAVFTQPVDATLKSLRFAYNDSSDAELSHETAAIPAWSERSDHYRIFVAALAAGFPKGVGLAVDRGVAFLYTAIVAAAKQVAFAVEKSSTDRNAALSKTSPGFFDGDEKHFIFIEIGIHILQFYKQTFPYANLVCMSQNFQPGDFLVFQLESGFALLKMLGADAGDGGKIWHLAAYADFFPDVERAEASAANSAQLTVSHPHIALTNRAFESTQVAKIGNVPLAESELKALTEWKNDPAREVSDRSVRLMLGLR